MSLTQNNTPPTVVSKSVRNIDAILKLYSKKYNYPLSNVDFDILSVESFILKNTSKIKVDIENLSAYKNKHSNVRQLFEVKIFAKNKIKFKIKNTILIYDKKSKVNIIFHKDSKIPYYDDLNSDLLKYIKKEKAKLNILLDTVDDSIQKNIDKLISIVKKNPTLKEDFTFDIFTSSSFMPSQKAYIKYPHIKDNLQNDVHRVFLFVNKNDVIIDIFKGDAGKDGFNCLGELCATLPIDKIDTRHISTSSNITTINDGHHIYHKAVNEGVAFYKNNIFDISKKFSFEDLDFKQCISFIAPLDCSDISINIVESSGIRDAVDKSITLQAHTIQITGNVGSSVKITSNILKLIGVAHSTSTIVSDKCFIKSAKGKITANDIEILTLEQGLVQGGDVKITNFIGGRVCGKNIIIENIHSNTNTKASNSIEIQKIIGSQNEMTISADGDKEILDDIIKYKKEIKDFTSIYTKEKLQQLSTHFNKQVSIVKDLKQQIKEVKENNGDSSELTRHASKILISITNMQKIFKQKETLESYKTQLQQYDKNIHQSYIQIHSPILPHNTIAFDKISSNTRVSDVVTDAMKYSLINNNDIDSIKMEMTI